MKICLVNILFEVWLGRKEWSCLFLELKSPTGDEELKQASPNQSESDPDEEEGGGTGLGQECFLVSEIIVSRRLEAQGGEGTNLASASKAGW